MGVVHINRTRKLLPFVFSYIVGKVLQFIFILNDILFFFRGHNYPVWCVTESSIGMYLATGSRDLTARLWSTDREFPLQTYVGHTQDVDVNYIAFIFVNEISYHSIYLHFVGHCISSKRKLHCHWIDRSHRTTVVRY